jgi:hypothetical protein
MATASQLWQDKVHRWPTVLMPRSTHPPVLAGTGISAARGHANSGLNAAESGCLQSPCGLTFAKRRRAPNTEGTFP